MEAKTTPVLVSASRRPPSAGPAKLPTLSIELDATFAAVSSSGRVASDGQQRRLRGPERRRDQLHAHGEPDREQRRAVEQRRRGRAADRERAQQVAGHHHALAPVAVAEDREERRRGGGGPEAQQRDHADGGGAAVPVRETESAIAYAQSPVIEPTSASSIRRSCGFRKTSR